MQIVWNSSMETGIRTIDRQHEELIGMINELAAILETRPDQATLEDILRRLKAYVIFHFSTEESLLANLPDQQEHALAHLAMHREFAGQLAAQGETLRADDAAALQGLLDYLQSWLLNHILKTDRQLGQLLNRQVVESAGIERVVSR